MADKTLKPGWRKVKFGDVVRQCKEKADAETSGLERYVAGDHMDTDDLRIRRWGEIGSGYLGPAFHMRFRPGQVLYGSRRTYLRKVAVADFDGICANTTFVLEPKNAEELLPEYLPFLMQTDSFNKFSVKNSKGSVNPYINFSDLARFEFALPSVEEQQSFCKVLFSIEDAIEALRCLEASAQELGQAQIDDYLRRSTSFPKVEIRQVCATNRPLCYGVVQPGNDIEDGVPLLRVCDIETPEVPIQSLKRITVDIDKEYKRSRVKAGDVLVSIVGTIGRLFVVPDECAGFNIARAIARISPGPGVDGRYVFYVLRTTEYQRLLSGASFETARKTLNLEQLAKLAIPLPSMEKQNELVDIFDRVKATSVRAKQRMLATAGIKAQMLAAIGASDV